MSLRHKMLISNHGSSVFLFLILLLGIYSASAVLYSSYRKDFFYPYDLYPEADLPSPVSGGRFHIIGVAQASGKVGDVYLNGKKVQLVSGNWDIDWLKVYDNPLTKGKPFWLSFHSRNELWDSISNASLKLETSDGATVASGNFQVAINFCNITYITTDYNMSTVFIHIHNGYTSTRTISQVLLNNEDLTIMVVNNASLTVASLSAVMLEIPLKTSLSRGSLMTAVVIYKESGAVPSVAGVRVAVPHFPIESWPKSDECPFPTMNDDNYNFIEKHGFDTYFFRENPSSECKNPVKGHDIISNLAPKYGFFGLMTTDVPLDKCTNLSNALAIFMGDEVDDKIDDSMRTLLAQILSTPQELLTYIGGSRSRRNGIFAGLADIQGMDMYIAACAPHIQVVTDTPQPRGSYDYLRLTRNNHMPLPTWLYSQAFDDFWDAKIGSHVLHHRQPNPNELLIQAMSVIVACAKGIMYFQSEIAENEYYPDTWTALGKFNKDIGAVGEYLRLGDCTDMVTNSDGEGLSADTVAQAIRSKAAIIVPVVSFHNHGGYNSLECAIGANLHWEIWNHTIDEITVTIPADFGTVVDKFEIIDGNISDISDVSVKTGNIVFSHVKMPSDRPIHLFVLANTADVRKDVQNRLRG